MLLQAARADPKDKNTEGPENFDCVGRFLENAIYLRMVEERGRKSVRRGIPTLYIPNHFLITTKPLPGLTQRHALVSIHPFQRLL